jgi:hypothetical protein
MMAETKLTKRDYFSQLREIVKDNESLVAFIDHELELLAKKNSSRSDAPSKTQIENKELSNQILDIMSTLDEAKTITELINETEIGKLTFGKENKAMTNQKLSRLVNDLAKANKVVRTETKGVAYFKAI